MKNKNLSFFFKMKGSSLNKCLAPKEECDNEAIRAHTVQNSRAIDLLVSSDNHVIGIEVKFSPSESPEFIYDRISRNKATTFTGLCSSHDSSLFQAIDTQKIDVKNLEHCFLLAYRSVMRELHSKMEVATKYQDTYYHLEEPDRFPNNIIGSSGVEATKSIMSAFETYNYKFKYDFIHEYKEYGYIAHSSIILEDQKPSVAVSSMFSLDNITNDEGDPVRIVINVLPVSTKRTIVLFSWLPEDEKAIKNKLNYIFSANGDYQKYEISKLVLRHCENFVISAKYFELWTEKKKQCIKGYFQNNMLAKWELDDPDINLFD